VLSHGKKGKSPAWKKVDQYTEGKADRMGKKSLHAAGMEKEGGEGDDGNPAQRGLVKREKATQMNCQFFSRYFPFSQASPLSAKDSVSRALT